MKKSRGRNSANNEETVEEVKGRSENQERKN